MPDPNTANTLRHATSATWDRIIAATNPPSMLVAIGGMMSHALRQSCDAEDVWQETLLHAWRSRNSFTWRGPGPFRRWLLEIARNRIRDLADQASAEKRGARWQQRFADRDASSGSYDAEHYAGPCARTTPGRQAADRESAAMFEQALETVPSEYRDVVRLRLFEDCSFPEIGDQLGLSAESVRYRFREGAESYRRALRRQRAVAPTTSGVDS